VRRINAGIKIAANRSAFFYQDIQAIRTYTVASQDYLRKISLWAHVDNDNRFFLAFAISVLRTNDKTLPDSTLIIPQCIAHLMLPRDDRGHYNDRIGLQQTALAHVYN
jgi:hypothetical protein